jgi:DnaJ-class molecular chaperone
MNHREVLGVGQSAGAQEIKDAFRKAAKEVHPDISDSPEAAEAFSRIKEAHDALLKDAEAPRESTTVQTSAARAAAATAQAAYTPLDPADPQLSDEEIAKQQELDAKALSEIKRSIFRRSKESTEVKKHRKKLRTNERRLRGLY